MKLEENPRSPAMKRLRPGVAFSMLLLLAACGGGAPEAKTPAGPPPGNKTDGPNPMSAEAQKGYNDALQSMVAHDKANDWTDASCGQVAKAFQDAAAHQKST